MIAQRIAFAILMLVSIAGASLGGSLFGVTVVRLWKWAFADGPFPWWLIILGSSS